VKVGRLEGWKNHPALSGTPSRGEYSGCTTFVRRGIGFGYFYPNGINYDSPGHPGIRRESAPGKENKQNRNPERVH